MADGGVGGEPAPWAQKGTADSFFFASTKELAWVLGR